MIIVTRVINYNLILFIILKATKSMVLNFFKAPILLTELFDASLYENPIIENIRVNYYN